LTEIIDDINKQILESAKIIKDVSKVSKTIEKTIEIIIKCLQSNKKILLCGNGGSAADSQHIAAEFIGRFNLERKSLPAISLTTDTSIITSIGNDYSFEDIFSRQCESLVLEGDIVIGISTSGNSQNIINALKKSKSKGAITIGVLGNGGGEIKKIVDISIIVSSSKTPRIQEAHRTIFHIICDIVEKKIVRNKKL
jgi:D-sedoheptulose 7-phosphate isomerase|tara:strand:- start:123 stop:710 length:588 start_codon:yes stop_codon:yes gene_type:complete